MSINIQQLKIPLLRFPIFKNDWQLERLENLLTRVGEPVTVLPDQVYREIGIRSHGKGLFHKESVTGESLGNKRVFKVYVPAFVVNIVFAWEHAIAQTSANEEGFIASHRFPMFKPKAHKSDLAFVRYFFLRKYGKHLLGLASPGGAGRNKTLGQKDFFRLKVSFPEIEEQQKIATFLSAVDTKIEQLSKKKTLLEQYKKGMMQKLFSQQIRFKDDKGSEYPDWEEKRLGELYTFKSTNSFSREKLNYESGEVLNIHYGDIHTSFRLMFKVKDENVPYINMDVDISRIPDDRYCKIGDLVIADASEDYNDIGKSIEIISLDGKKVLAGLHTLLARLNSDTIQVGYGGYMISTESVRRQIMRIAQGIKVLGVSTGRMNDILLAVPSIEEQKKIANFLSAIDRKIELVSRQLEKAQTFKKGLLQQMFV